MAAFLKVKQVIDGAVFWREVEGGKVEIKMAFPNKRIRKIVESLMD
jgi:hypothetical protein